MAAAVAIRSVNGMMHTVDRSDATRDRSGRTDVADRVRYARPTGPRRAIPTIRRTGRAS